MIEQMTNLQPPSAKKCASWLPHPRPPQVCITSAVHTSQSEPYDATWITDGQCLGRLGTTYEVLRAARHPEELDMQCLGRLCIPWHCPSAMPLSITLCKHVRFHS